MKIFNHRGTENTEGLYALSLPNLEAIRDDLIKFHDRKTQSFHIEGAVRAIRNGQTSLKKNVLFNGSSHSVERAREVTIHSFRHTWITHALTNGLDVNKVRAYAGHRNISTTAIYLHLIGSVQEMAVDIKSFVKTHFHLTSTSLPRGAKLQAKNFWERSAFSFYPIDDQVITI